MKTKIFLCASMLLGLSLASCSDDDNYFISTDPVVDESSVATGSTDVTANSATLHGTVEGLDGKAASFYSVGFYYGETAENLPNRVDGSLDGDVVSASVTGLTTGKTYYYQAYVTLKGQVTFRGEVKSFVTTNATVVTEAVSAVDFASAVMGGTVTEAPAGSTSGVVISADPDVEKVRAGLKLTADGTSAFSVTYSGLVPSTKYYYAAYLDLGAGVVYGDVKEFTTDAHQYDADEDFVDLGLSVKWAKMNIGAKSETEAGGYFGFGDLAGVNNSYKPEDFLSGDIYRTRNDVAWNITGGLATLPSYQEYEELFANCRAEWTEENGVAGYRLTAANGNSIFLPAAGSRTINDINGAGSMAYYATGSSNPSDGKFYYTYQFSSGNSARAITPVYQAVSVRPVSVARNVPFVKENLYTVWYLDNGQDGKLHGHKGPFTQWGETDNWDTVTNNYINPDQQINWDLEDNNEWFGYKFGFDYGSMEFLQDGTVKIHRIAGDGTVSDETGHFTIDETDKTIDIDIPVLCADTWVATKSGKLKILALDKDGLRIALPNGDGYAYSANYYSEAKRVFDGSIPVNLLFVDGNWSGTWGTVIDYIESEKLEAKHTFTYSGSAASAMVVTLDLQTLLTKYPQAVVYINDIRCDGTSISFDANDFFYGDIEDNGNYRIELFNIYGKGSKDGKVIKSPFSSATDAGSEPAFNFSSTLEIDLAVALSPASFTPGLVTINPSWGGDWTGPNDGAFTAVVDENNKLVPSKKDFDITLNAAAYGVDYTAGSIMTFVNTPDLMNVFPGTHMTLNSVSIDGVKLSGYDASKVVNSNDGATHRLELWNCYGVTASAGCAFGTPIAGDGTQIITELGFGTSMNVNFTIDSLFPVVNW